MIRGVAKRMAAPHAQRLDATATPLESVEEACEVLRDQHIVADWEQDGDEILLHERTCPYPEVARENSSVCAIDIAFVRELTHMARAWSNAACAAATAARTACNRNPQSPDRLHRPLARRRTSVSR